MIAKRLRKLGLANDTKYNQTQQARDQASARCRQHQQDKPKMAAIR